MREFTLFDNEIKIVEQCLSRRLYELSVHTKSMSLHPTNSSITAELVEVEAIKNILSKISTESNSHV